MSKLNIFISYSHKDEDFKEALDSHLTMLKRSDKIAAWNDRAILPGSEWDAEIKNQLENADLILLLISARFLASDYIWKTELTRAMERHDRGTARIIPIFIKECDWSGAPFGKVQGLPKDAKPVGNADNDAAWSEVAKGIRAVVDALLSGSPPPVPEKKKVINEDDFDRIFIHQKVTELVKPYLKEWPVADDLVAACVKFRCLDDFNYFKRLEGTISKALFQQKVKERIEKYKGEVQASEKRHADREPRWPFERYWLQHEDGSLTLEHRPAKNPLTGLTAYTRITNSVAMAFLEEVFIERSAREKAEKLVQQAESKAENDFQRWATEYLPKRLKHRTKADKTQFLRERYGEIEDGLHKLSQPLLIGLSRKEIVRWVTNFFIDLSDGLNPRFSPPEHLKNILADRFKANLCLEHIDKLLSQSPEPLEGQIMEQPAPHTEPLPALDVLYQDGIREHLSTLIQKLNRIRQAYAIETDAGQKFKYEQDIRALEAEIAALKDR